MSRYFAVRNTVVTLLMAFAASLGCNAASRAPIPAPAADSTLAQTPGKQTAVFAGGCFWGTQSVFERVKGCLIPRPAIRVGPPQLRPTNRLVRRTRDTRSQ